MKNNCNERRVLFVIDPQIDFITGSLPVPGAAKAMDALAQYITDNSHRWERKVITGDWHPLDHCSFAEHGGQWPMHCVAHSEGAAIYMPILEACHNSSGSTAFMHKGDDPKREEYSIMQNPVAAQALTLELGSCTEIDVTGIAGDVCVLNTVKDLVRIFGSRRVHVLPEFCPSLDGGKALADYLQEMGIDDGRSE